MSRAAEKKAKCAFSVSTSFLLFAVSCADAPDYAQITMEGNWKTSDGKIISEFKVKVFLAKLSSVKMHWDQI